MEFKLPDDSVGSEPPVLDTSTMQLKAEPALDPWDSNMISERDALRYAVTYGEFRLQFPSTAELNKARMRLYRCKGILVEKQRNQYVRLLEFASDGLTLIIRQGMDMLDYAVSIGKTQLTQELRDDLKVDSINREFGMPVPDRGIEPLD